MERTKINDIIFWLIIIAIIAIALWLLSGSPPEINALISIALFVAASEILLWKFLFNIDKKTAIGFTKISNQLDNMQSEITKINNSINKS